MGTTEKLDLHEEPRVPRQRTLKGSIDCTGIALHSGVKVHMTLCPADPDTGIVFIRADVRDRDPVVPARWDRVVDTRLCTVLGNADKVTVGTVEHLMAAFAGLRVDNAIVRLDGPEVPVMDGSAEPFVFLIECAGIREQETSRRCIRVLREIEVEDDAWKVSISPARGFSVRFEMDYEARGLPRQEIRLGLVNGTFKKELSRARTFGFLQDVERLRAVGLARGGNMENAIVVDAGRVLNPDGLRYQDEFVRHKSLDAVGDLYLAGLPIMGHFHGRCSGHGANNRLLRALFANPDAWRVETLTEGEEAAARLANLWRDDVPLAATA